MEKVNFVCWLNTTFYVGKPHQKPRPSLINIIWTLLRRMEWFRSGVPNFVLVVRAQKPYQVQVVQIRSLHQKWSIKSMILFWMTRKWNRLGKLWLVFFVDAHGEFFINYLEKGRSITGAYYLALLNRLVDEIRKNRPHLKKKKILFHIENAPSHTLNIWEGKKHELGFESFPHPPYSPDLAPSDYYLFLNLKRWLCVRRFESNEEVEWETEGYFGGFYKSYYLEGIEKLNGRWTRIELKWGYIEK